MKISENVSEFLYAVGTIIIFVGTFILILTGW